ncbi:MULTISPECIES: acyl-CoA thioesterase [Bacillus]|uniref:Acyl-CoA thioesterase n=1 Tax=Bacillus cereus TaxID=1396 RepID=A0A2C1LLD1_BACCE|nr:MULTISPECIES: acyl-CoA thioesterase [Bacillus]MDH4423008.1 acyl-CoA thioesterase [Bacillus cereus]PER22465.1 acyl-CoA thioesterase [Bacillus cereus]PFA61402.1 acyl-CoA thioesterase [Bacillus sp. AFS015896]PGL84925.1 acyl-CoA thioesterase [Bacillus sp. AFS054943]PGT99272.1 acyl-CoA thioesterase [Bacillus cereus]
MEKKFMRESKAIKTTRVFPNDLNNHQTLFGGKLLAEIDSIASIAAARHSRKHCVTASIDSVDFLTPIHQADSVCYEAFVCYTGKSSMEVFVKVIAENLLAGERRIAATCFITFVALKDGKPSSVPQVLPETEEEHWLHTTGSERAENRKKGRLKSKEMAEVLTLSKPWGM